MGKLLQNNPNSVQNLTIDRGIAGQRIDNFLLARLKGVPRSLVYRILRRGEVRVNKGRVKPDYRLQDGDTVRVPPLRLSSKPSGQPSERLRAQINASILYEDKRLLVLNKPSGVAVHGGSGLSHGVIETLRALRPTAPYLELVHRLDRETSGCLMIAKRRSTLRELHTLLRENQVDKRYLALVRGPWRGGVQQVDARLHKNVLQSGERMVRVSDEGKRSRSEFTPLSTCPIASLMEVKLETGRTHQVRVHAAHAGHPLAGDSKYGDEAFNRQMRGLGLRRLFLHAASIAFEILETNYHIKVTAPLPQELCKVLEQLGMTDDFRI